MGRNRWPLSTEAGTFPDPMTRAQWAFLALVIAQAANSMWSLVRGGYTPGVATAPVLFLLALYLAHRLRQSRSSGPAAE